MTVSRMTPVCRGLMAALTLIAAIAVSGTAGAQTDTTFSNTAPITINDWNGVDSGAATPYPSDITVSGLVGAVSKVTVTLTGFAHTGPRDVDMLLVSPTGQKVFLMGDTGDTTAVTGLNITFDDAAAASLPTGAGAELVSGTFKPTNFDDAEGADTFPAPAPAGPYGTTLATVITGDPNGVWQLFINDDASGGTGSITGGWSITITTGAAPPTTKLLVTGTGAGGGPHVRIWQVDTTGNVTELGTGFFAYDPGFLGGVSVAITDFNNDGTPEIVTAPRGNGGPHVRVFSLDKTTGTVTPVGNGFLAYDPGFLGGVSFAIQDVDGDGIPEILTAPNSNGGPHVKAFKFDIATGNATDFGALSFFAYDPGFFGGISLAAEP